MHTVEVTSEYQLDIPQEARKKLNIKVGQKFQIIEYQGRLEYIPVKEIKRLRGFLKGIDTTVKRDNDRL